LSGEDSYDESDYDEDEGQKTNRKLDDDTTPAKQKLSDRQLWLAVPFVRGYALKTKKWLWFFVKSIVDIEWSDGAFKSLVLPEDQKDLILAFAKSQMKNKDSFDDVIQGKGRGIILLLSGPPGVGKTLTAKSVAETMRVPLYMMSAGDLGLEPADIESALQNIMEMVAKWGAVLLLDEGGAIYSPF
jgi:SpoVK/Ycf46/Vps4 family AAA+-type ATPase